MRILVLSVAIYLSFGVALAVDVDVPINPRSCLKNPPETVIDSCPSLAGASCPSGSCTFPGVPYIGGCKVEGQTTVFANTESSSSVILSNPAQAAPGTAGVGPITESGTGLLCYKRWVCDCDMDVYGGSSCNTSEDMTRFLIYQWFMDPSAICLGAEYP